MPAFTFAVGPVRVAVTCDDDAVRDLARERCGGFTTTKNGPFRLSLHAADANGPPTAMLDDPDIRRRVAAGWAQAAGGGGEQTAALVLRHEGAERARIAVAQPEPAVEAAGTATLVRRGPFVAVLDPDTATAHAFFPRSQRSAGIETALRVATAAAAIGTGALLLHACAVALSGSTAAFPGRSGAGKSTIASLAPADADVLGDELVLVHADADPPVAYATPFSGTCPRRDGAGAPLRAILFPVKDDVAAVRRLAAQAGLASLLRAAVHCRHDARGADAMLELAVSLAARVEMANLHFRRDRSFWPLVAGVVASRGRP